MFGPQRPPLAVALSVRAMLSPGLADRPHFIVGLARPAPAGAGPRRPAARTSVRQQASGRCAGRQHLMVRPAVADPLSPHDSCRTAVVTPQLHATGAARRGRGGHVWLVPGADRAHWPAAAVLLLRGVRF